MAAQPWTFGKKIALGFAMSFVLLAAIGFVAYRSIDSLTRTSYAVTHSHAVLEHLALVVVGLVRGVFRVDRLDFGIDLVRLDHEEGELFERNGERRHA